jgi:hypothetical protein
MRAKFYGITVMLFMLLTANSVFAEGAKWVQPGFFINNSIGAAMNPKGLGLTTEILYRIPFIKNEGMLWRSTKIDFGVVNFLTPSMERISVMLHFEPIAVFDIKMLAGYDYEYAGLTGGLFPMAKWNSKYDEDTRWANTPNPGNYGGFRMDIIPTFKVALGPVALLYTFKYTYFDYNYAGFLYDAELDTIVYGTDNVFKHDIKLLYRIKNVRVGATYNITQIESTGEVKDTIDAMCVYTPKWSFMPENITPYGVLLMGTHFQDRIFTYAFHLAGLIGLNIKVF